VQATVDAARLQAADGHAAPHLHPVLGLGRPREGVLEGRPSRGPGHEPLVARARVALRQRRGHPGGRVEPERARRRERLLHVGQLGLQHLAPARLHEVRLAELRHATPAPALPGRLGTVRDGRRVAFQDGDAMPVAGQHHPGRQTAHAGAEHDGVEHRRTSTRDSYTE
jgi:hypothetical protein